MLATISEDAGTHAPVDSPAPRSRIFSMMTPTSKRRSQSSDEEIATLVTPTFTRRLSVVFSAPRRMSTGKGSMTIEFVRLKEENQICADCTAKDPTWASVNIGCFICTQCAGVHRSLGTHISFVLSCRLDKWRPDQVCLQCVFNKKIFVYKLLTFCKPIIAFLSQSMCNIELNINL
jgi:hypothetical protein